MVHGCTEPSSTLHPYAFTIALHNMTDPMGANANATMTKSASKYHSHGNLLCGLPFMVSIPNHRSRVNILLVRSNLLSTEFSGRSRVSRPSPTAQRTQSAPICPLPENAPACPRESSHP